MAVGWLGAMCCTLTGTEERTLSVKPGESSHKVLSPRRALQLLVGGVPGLRSVPFQKYIFLLISGKGKGEGERTMDWLLPARP